MLQEIVQRLTCFTVCNDEGDVAPLATQASPVLARPTKWHSQHQFLKSHSSSSTKKKTWTVRTLNNVPTCKVCVSSQLHCPCGGVNKTHYDWTYKLRFCSGLSPLQRSLTNSEALALLSLLESLDSQLFTSRRSTQRSDDQTAI